MLDVLDPWKSSPIIQLNTELASSKPTVRCLKTTIKVDHFPITGFPHWCPPINWMDLDVLFLPIRKTTWGGHTLRMLHVWHSHQAVLPGLVNEQWKFMVIEWWFNGISWELNGIAVDIPSGQFSQLDPEHHQFLEETSIFQPRWLPGSMLIYWRVTEFVMVLVENVGSYSIHGASG